MNIVVIYLFQVEWCRYVVRLRLDHVAAAYDYIFCFSERHTSFLGVRFPGIRRSGSAVRRIGGDKPR